MKPHSNKTSHAPSKRAQRTSQLVQWPLLLRAVGMGLGTVVFAIVLLGASGNAEDDEATSRKKIEAMSPAQRAQLKRNYEKYQKLSVADKERYQKIHIATRGPSKLNRLMHSYNDWVKTLSPWQQEDLRNAKTTAQRIELIRKFRSVQERSKQADKYKYDIIKLLAANSRDPKIGQEFMRGYIPWMASPPADLFQEAIKIIEGNLTSPVKYPKPVDQLSEYERSLAILKSFTELQDREDSPNRSAEVPREVIDQIAELMDEKNFQIRVFGRNLDGNKFPRGFRNRGKVMPFLMRGLMDQFFTSAKQQLDQIQPQPSEEELQNYFETSLKTQEQDSLMNHPPEVMQEKLKYHYLRKHLPPEVRESLLNQLKEYIRLMRVGQFTRGTKDRGVRRPGERPLNNGNRGGNRPGGPRGKGPKPRPQGESRPDA